MMLLFLFVFECLNVCDCEQAYQYVCTQVKNN